MKSCSRPPDGDTEDRKIATAPCKWSKNKSNTSSVSAECVRLKR